MFFITYEAESSVSFILNFLCIKNSVNDTTQKS